MCDYESLQDRYSQSQIEVSGASHITQSYGVFTLGIQLPSYGRDLTPARLYCGPAEMDPWIDGRS